MSKYKTHKFRETASSNLKHFLYKKTSENVFDSAVSDSAVSGSPVSPTYPVSDFVSSFPLNISANSERYAKIL